MLSILCYQASSIVNCACSVLRSTLVCGTHQPISDTSTLRPLQDGHALSQTTRALCRYSLMLLVLGMKLLSGIWRLGFTLDHRTKLLLIHEHLCKNSEVAHRYCFNVCCKCKCFQVQSMCGFSPHDLIKIELPHPSWAAFRHCNS